MNENSRHEAQGSNYSRSFSISYPLHQNKNYIRAGGKGEDYCRGNESYKLLSQRRQIKSWSSASQRSSY